MVLAVVKMVEAEPAGVPLKVSGMIVNSDNFPVGTAGPSAVVSEAAACMPGAHNHYYQAVPLVVVAVAVADR